VSRLYEALRKVEEQGQRSPSSAPVPSPGAARNVHPLLAVPSLHAQIGPESRIVTFTDRTSPGSERFRLIRMTLRNAYAGKLPQVLLITSPLPKDGKSTVALNLATSLSEQGKFKVLLVEADLRRPSLLSRLGADHACGLTEVVADLADPAAAIRRIEPLDFYLLPSGRLPDNPTELLQTERFEGLLRDLKACFDWILIDSPPAMPLSDVVALRPHADGVVVVARAGSTPREAVQETLQLFKPGQVAGFILNGADGLDQLYETYYRHYAPQ
jgi:capsular exopolysaccharide synthesis family protein